MPDPMLKNSTDVLIKIKAVGICGSDVHYFQHGCIGQQVVKFPYIVGHECSGEVVEISRGVTRFKPGDRVVVDPAVSCRTCTQCRAGRFHTCKKLQFLGTPAAATTDGRDGCLREYIVMPELSLFHLPAELSFEDGALIEPLTIGHYAVLKSEAAPGQTVAILGSGPIGLSVLTVLSLKHFSSIYCTDLISERLAVASQLGATQSYQAHAVDVAELILSCAPEGMDVVFECAGQQETIDQGIELLKPGGTLVLIGIPTTSRISMNPDLLRRKELRLQNIRRQNECTQATIDLIQQTHLNLSPFKTHHFSPAESQAAFELVQNYQDGVIKAFINWDE
jgi:L-iditol 2-dehydrogenase